RSQEEFCRNILKLGFLLGDAEDISCRTNLAIPALLRTWKVLTPSMTSEVTLRRLYSCYMFPILLYSSSTWALTQPKLR
ncbi:hypothetical protein PHMEG_00013969, partial [Phytophthora megakarya]